MSESLLYTLTALLCVLAPLCVWQVVREQRRRRSLTMSEWLAGMRRLDEDIPLKQPKFRTREMRKGFDITECQPQEKVTAIRKAGAR